MASKFPISDFSEFLLLKLKEHEKENTRQKQRKHQNHCKGSISLSSGHVMFLNLFTHWWSWKLILICKWVYNNLLWLVFKIQTNLNPRCTNFYFINLSWISYLGISMGIKASSSISQLSLLRFSILQEYWIRDSIWQNSSHFFLPDFEVNHWKVPSKHLCQNVMQFFKNMIFIDRKIGKVCS